MLLHLMEYCILPLIHYSTTSDDELIERTIPAWLNDDERLRRCRKSDSALRLGCYV